MHNAYAENETVNERLIRVEESIKSLDIRLTQRIDDTNKRIDELRQDINRIFDSQNVFNYFIIGGIFTMLISIYFSWLLTPLIAKYC